MTTCKCGTEFDPGLFKLSRCPACQDEQYNAQMEKNKQLADVDKIRAQRLAIEVIAARVNPPTVRSQIPCQAGLDQALGWSRNQYTKPVLLFYGPSRTGKTRISEQATCEWLGASFGRRADWWQGEELRAATLDALRGTDGTLWGFQKQLIAAPWLVIDDFGHSTLSEKVGATFLHVLDQRNANMRPTVITVQASDGVLPMTEPLWIVEQIGKRLESALTGEAVSSRLYEFAHIIPTF